jgi:hypothetical protein
MEVDARSVGGFFCLRRNRTEMQASFYQLFSGVDGAEGRCFVEFLEPPASINVLPKPGTYKHPQYGDVVITEEINREFVTNFQQQVYQRDIPIDAEHETKLSGALGYLRDLRINADGSVEAGVEWNERGRELLRGDRYHYISPQWFEEWEDPASNKKHEHVLVGAALTTRPFFKEGALRPLVSNEGGLWDVDGEGTGLPPEDAAAWRFVQPAPADGHVNQIMLGAVWDTKFINDLPDGAFAVVKAGGKKNGDGKTVPRSLRMLPHHGAGDVVDLPHLRAALARVAQSGTLLTPAERSRAAGHLQTHARQEEVGEAVATELASLVEKAARVRLDGKGGDRMDDPTNVAELKSYVETDEGKGWFKGLIEHLGFSAPDPEPDPKPDPDPEKESEAVKEMTERLTAESTKREALEKQVSTLTEANRSQRYRELVLGRDEPSLIQAKEGTIPALRPMVGDHAKLVTTLKIIADAKGEDSDEFKSFIAHEREHAHQLHEAGLYKEVGTDSVGAPAGGGAPKQVVEDKINEYMNADKELTRPKAIVKLAREEPKLYDDYDRAISKRDTPRVGQQEGR